MQFGSKVAIDIKFVTPAELHSFWPWMLRGLWSIHKRNDCDWLPEDIYTSLRTGNAQLIIPFHNEIAQGFTIFYFNPTPFSNRKECIIWCAWTPPLREQSNRAIVEQSILMCFDEIVKIAKREGCFRVTSISSRKGYEIWAAKFGLKKKSSTYALSL